MRSKSTPPADDRNQGVLGDARALRKPRKERGQGGRRPLTLAVLVIIACLAGGLLLADRLWSNQPEATAPTAAATATLIDKGIADLASVKVSPASGDYTLVPTGFGFGLVGSPDFAVDFAKASRLFLSCALLPYDSVVEQPAPSCWATGPPAARITT